MLINESDYNDEMFSSLLVTLFNIGDITVIFRALDKFSKKKLFKDAVCKREIGDALYTLFRGTTDMASKTQLLDYAIQMKIENAFLRDGKKKKDFSPDEEQLLKDGTKKYESAK